MCVANEHQIPDHPRIFIKIVWVRAITMSATNDERLQFLNLHVIWDGNIDQYEVYSINVKAHYG
jgi:hypothetical protein